MRAILLALLEEMEWHEAGVIAATDSEFLHQLRIAVRRSRSLLAEAEGILPPATVARFSETFAWLGSETSRCRDLDVYLLNFDTFCRALPKKRRRDLDPLHDFLQQQHAVEHERLAALLHSARYLALKQQWRSYLSGPLPKRPVAAEAKWAVADTASERTLALYRRVVQSGGEIDAQSPATQLHRLRKQCKRLRYMLELFTPLYPEKQLRRPIARLKRLQENLGRFQDLTIQTATLQRFCEEMEQAQLLPPETARAVKRLQKVLLKRADRVRKKFDKLFGRFSSKGNRRRFRQLRRAPA